MRRIISFVISIIMVMVLCGCNEKKLEKTSEKVISLIADSSLLIEGPNNHKDPSSFRPLLMENGMFHRASVNGVNYLSFRTENGVEMPVLMGVPSNIFYVNHYLYVTMLNDRPSLPDFYRINMENMTIDEFPERVQQVYVYLDGDILWYSQKDQAYYYSSWLYEDKQAVLQDVELLKIISSENETFLYDDNEVYKYVKGKKCDCFYRAKEGEGYIQDCYLTDDRLYIVIYKSFRERQLLSFTLDGVLTDVSALVNVFNTNLYSSNREQLFILPGDAYAALKNWLNSPISYEQQLHLGFVLFSISSDRNIRVYLYQNTIVFSYVDMDYREYTIVY